MRKGCVLSATLLVVLIVIGGYFGYTLLRQNFDLPDDLAPYAEADSLSQFIHSTEPPPPDTAHLTAEQVALFIGAFDSLNTGWYSLRHTFDSLGIQNATGKTLDLWKSPTVLRDIIKLPLLTRKGLVSYLNARNLSLAEYVWLKERTVAASGITHRDISTIFRDSLGQYLPVPDSSPIEVGAHITAFFARVEQIRHQGVVDSSDMALVAPYRQKILHEGLGAFMSLELDNDMPAAVIKVE